MWSWSLSKHGQPLQWQGWESGQDLISSLMLTSDTKLLKLNISGWIGLLGL